MQRALSIALALVFVGWHTSVIAQEYVLPTETPPEMVDMEGIERQLDARGLHGVHRIKERAELVDEASAPSGTLRPGQTLVVPFTLEREGDEDAEVHSYEFTFKYRQTRQLVQGIVQVRDKDGWTRTPVSEAWGDGGTLTFRVGMLVQEDEPQEAYFWLSSNRCG